MLFTEEEINKFINNYEGFQLNVFSDFYSIRGIYHFAGRYNGVELEDYFDIEIIIYKFGDNIPTVFEHMRISDFHHKYTDNSLCLEIPMKIKIDTKRYKYDLASFFEVFIIPYLYGYLHYEKYHTLPFGERSHNEKGYIEYFEDVFGLNSESSTRKFLNYISTHHEYRGHHDCPCGSGQRIRSCHKDVLMHYYNEKNEVVLTRFREYYERYINVKSKNKRKS